MIERKICHLSRTQHNELCQLFDKEALSNLAVSKSQSYKESNHRHPCHERYNHLGWSDN